MRGTSGRRVAMVSRATRLLAPSLGPYPHPLRDGTQRTNSSQGTVGWRRTEALGRTLHAIAESAARLVVAGPWWARNRAGYARPSSIASLPTRPRPPPAGAAPAPPRTAVPDAVPAPAPATVPEPVPDTQCESVRLLFATPPQHSTQRRCSIFFTLPGPNSEQGWLANGPKPARNRRNSRPGVPRSRGASAQCVPTSHCRRNRWRPVLPGEGLSPCRKWRGSRQDRRSART
jgi:hypothetical protein